MFYIDGNNLEAHTHPKRVGTPQAEQYLTNLLDRFANEQNKSVILVFDGVRPLPRPRGKLRIVYPTHSDQIADNTIVRLLTDDPQRMNSVVVTGDRELIQRVQRLGARVKDRLEFLNSIPPAREINHRPEITSPAEIDHWLEVFDIPQDHPIHKELAATPTPQTPEQNQKKVNGEHIRRPKKLR